MDAQKLTTVVLLTYSSVLDHWKSSADDVAQPTYVKCSSSFVKVLRLTFLDQRGLQE